MTEIASVVGDTHTHTHRIQLWCRQG